MESLIETFHIDIKILVAQAINFTIVLVVLYFFALKPLIRTMTDRTKKIEKSVEDAKRIEERLTNAEGEYEKKIVEAKKGANKIMRNSREQAEARKKEMMNRAKEEVGQIINQEKAKIRVEKAKILKEIKGEVAGLVVASVEKVLEKKIDSKEEKELIGKMVGKHK